MIISKTPYRISFFGGGTDFPEWYINNGGEVLSTSIDKYCYVLLRSLPPFFEHKHRIVYSKIENITNIEEIEHPVIREAIKQYRLNDGLEIHHIGDLPARSGVGSSSAFTVGLLNAIYFKSNIGTSKKHLALEAIKLERDKLNETVGMQDQIATSFGGLNNIKFRKNGEIDVLPINLSSSRLHALNNNLMLFFTGISRSSSEIAKHQLENIDKNNILLTKMSEIVGEAIDILNNKLSNIDDFGYLLDKTWDFKKKLSSFITNDSLEFYYFNAKKSGAIGGKLLGAGGGGFFLIYANEKNHQRIKETLKEWLYVPFNFEFNGTHIIDNGKYF